jgi:hypothetical protein
LNLVPALPVSNPGQSFRTKLQDKDSAALFGSKPAVGAEVDVLEEQSVKMRAERTAGLSQSTRISTEAAFKGEQMAVIASPGKVAVWVCRI